MVLLLSQALQERGLRVAVVTRGYRGEGEGKLLVVSDGERVRETYPRVGDEPFLLARRLPGVQVIMAADRKAGCEVAIGEFGAEVILLDDGFQHLKVERDLDILLVDGTNPFGYGYLLPRGLLREPVSALRRADLLVITSATAGGNFQDLERVLKGYASVPILQAVYTPTLLTDLETGETIPWEAVQGQKVLAFSGIANPANFERTLRSAGIHPCQHLGFADHHPYGPEDLREIRRIMEEHGAALALTTEKDAMRLTGIPFPFPVAVFGVKLSLEAGWDELERCFDTLFPSR
jgi:tetraacyldisaccharide 4'-kinase